MFVRSFLHQGDDTENNNRTTLFFNIIPNCVIQFVYRFIACIYFLLFHWFSMRRIIIPAPTFAQIMTTEMAKRHKMTFASESARSKCLRHRHTSGSFPSCEHSCFSSALISLYRTTLSFCFRFLGWLRLEVFVVIGEIVEKTDECRHDYNAYRDSQEEICHVLLIEPRFFLGFDFGKSGVEADIIINIFSCKRLSFFPFNSFHLTSR